MKRWAVSCDSPRVGEAPAGGALVRASYRNAKGAAREVKRRIALPGSA